MLPIVSLLDTSVHASKLPRNWRNTIQNKFGEIRSEDAYYRGNGRGGSRIFDVFLETRGGGCPVLVTARTYPWGTRDVVGSPIRSCADQYGSDMLTEPKKVEEGRLN
jgi:hypothetical protein